MNAAQLTCQATRHAVGHVFASSWRADSFGWVPLPWTAKQKLARMYNLNYTTLEDAVQASVLEVRRRDLDGRDVLFVVEEGLCQEYRIAPELSRDLAHAEHEALQQGSGFVNLHTGKRTRARFRDDRHDANRNPYPALVRAGMDTGEGPLYGALQSWHRYLESTWTDRVAYAGPGGRWVRNEVEMPLHVRDGSGHWMPELHLPHVRRARLAAYALQGREAAFIFTLTQLGSDYGFRVISSQHDGLLTLGAIPPEAIAETKRRTRMDYARLVEKPFC